MHEDVRSGWSHRMHEDVRSEWPHRMHEAVSASGHTDCMKM